MFLESSKKLTKISATSLVGLFIICVISENTVTGMAVQKAPTTKDFRIVSAFKDGLSAYNSPRSQVISSELISSAADMTVDDTNGSHHHQIRMSAALGNSISANSDSSSLDGKLTRFKRSAYPPGYVAWTWREPCFCPPGQYLTCRCHTSNNKMANFKSSSSEEGNRRKRKRSRSKKLKLKF